MSDCTLRPVENSVTVYKTMVSFEKQYFWFDFDGVFPTENDRRAGGRPRLMRRTRGNPRGRGGARGWRN